MAYPFDQMPTLGELVADAIAAGWEAIGLDEGKPPLVIYEGSTRAVVRYLRKTGEHPVILPNIGTDERLTPIDAQSLCRRLGLENPF
jgi:hypothetical protein